MGLGLGGLGDRVRLGFVVRVWGKAYGLGLGLVGLGFGLWLGFSGSVLRVRLSGSGQGVRG